MSKKNRFPVRLVKSTEGGAAVEFALVLTVLLMLLMGMIDFGHAFFLRQIVVNASREGARAGVVYPHLAAEITGNATTGVITYWPLTDPPTIIVDPGTGAAGTPLKVTVSYTKTWWLINCFVPGLGDTVDISAETSMRYE